MLFFTRRLGDFLLSSGGRTLHVQTHLRWSQVLPISQALPAYVDLPARILHWSNLPLKEALARLLMGAPISVSPAMPTSWSIRWTSHRWPSLLHLKEAPRPLTIQSQNVVSCRLHCQMAQRTINHAIIVQTWLRQSSPQPQSWPCPKLEASKDYLN
jgi:hypothetical protein